MEGKAVEKGKRLRIWANFCSHGGEKFLLVSQFVTQVFSLAVTTLGRPAQSSCQHQEELRVALGGGGRGAHSVSMAANPGPTPPNPWRIAPRSSG